MVETQDQPLVSIIIPTRDRCAFLLETLASVQSQTYQCWEAVVVDDLSNDDTWPVLQGLAARDPRIRPLRRAGPLGGAPVARNQGLEAAHGNLVLFLDSDDLLSPCALERRVKAGTAHPDEDCWVFRNEHFRTAPGDSRNENPYRLLFFRDIDVLDAFLTDNPPWYVSSPLWRREALTRVGPWKTGYKFSQDREYHVRALVKGLRYRQFIEIDQFIRQHAGPRIWNNNSTRTISSKISLHDDLLKLLREYQMDTPRRKHLLDLAAFWGAVGYATGSLPRPGFGEVNPLWRAARDRGLVGGATYFAGCIILLTQKLGPLSVLPREFCRLLFYNYLAGRALLHPAVLRILSLRIWWKFTSTLDVLIERRRKLPRGSEKASTCRISG
jgi:glycosyltransferase involved in cell wall biosynthesis